VGDIWWPVLSGRGGGFFAEEKIKAEKKVFLVATTT